MTLWRRMVFALPLLLPTTAAPALAATEPAAKDVRVVNTSAEPVPVVATGPVALAEGTRVDVSNTAATALHVVQATREVFVRTAYLEWASEGASNAFTSIDVPAGKRLVIEFVSGRVGTGEGQTVDFILFPSANGGNGEFRFPTTARRADHGGLLYDHYYRFSAAVTLYHDGGRALRVGASRSVLDSGPAQGSLSVSGYLVDLP